jgi:hypothetical protein
LEISKCKQQRCILWTEKCNISINWMQQKMRVWESAKSQYHKPSRISLIG